MPDTETSSNSAEMNVIVICACVPTFLPLIQQVTGKKNYLAKKLPDPTLYNGSRCPLRKSVSLRPLTSQATAEGSTKEDSQRSLPQRDIRTTTTVESQWEAVCMSLGQSKSLVQIRFGDSVIIFVSCRRVSMFKSASYVVFHFVEERMEGGIHLLPGNQTRNRRDLGGGKKRREYTRRRRGIGGDIRLLQYQSNKRNLVNDM